MRTVAAVLAGVVVAGGLLAAWVWLVQRRLLFPAPRLDARSTIDLGDGVPLTLHVAGASVEAFFLPSTAPDRGPTPLIVFTHGNAELAQYWVEAFAEPRSWGVGAMLVEYPGYGRSGGTPSEESITQASAAALEWARRDARVDASRIVAYGRSLGGGPAIWLARHHQVRALILESSFTSVRSLAARYAIPGFLIRDPFDNLSALRGYRGPLLVLHGRHDSIVPVAHGRALAGAVPGAEFHELACDHNDCPRSWATVRLFLEAHGVIRPPGITDARRSIPVG